MRLTVKERVLLYLLEHGGPPDSIQASEEATQPKIAEAVGVKHRHISQYMRPLLAEGLVHERKAHVKGIPQRRRAYALSDAGRLAAIRLRDSVKSASIRIRDATGECEASVAEILSAFRGIGVSRIVREMEKGEPVDLAYLTAPPEAKTVEMLADAPQIRNFVGRSTELDRLTSEEEAARLLVIRGIAGIGKTWLAAEACERLRGRRNLFWHRVRPWDTRQSVLLHLGEFLAALEKPGLRAVLTRGKADRAAEVLREDLPGTQCFLVFDDAHEAAEEVRPVFRMLLEALAEASDARAVLLSRRALQSYDRRDVVVRRLVHEIDLAGLEMPEVFAFLSTDGGPILSAPFRRKILSHPLLLELYRAHRAFPIEAGGDVRRFLEEVLYAELPEAERKMMGVASLYEVPVSRDALFADARWSHNTLLSLTNRSLIRTVGEERFETHDTIREAFASLLAPAERRELGRFAVQQLKELATRAWVANRFGECAGYLANALHLVESAKEKSELWERLGDAYARTGDLLAFSVAYRESLKGTVDSESLARRHRKLASALCGHGELDAALAEIEAGSKSLGDTKSVERGWLELVRSRIRNRQLRSAREPAETALLTFQAFGELRGQAEAHLELADSAAMGGAKALDGSPLADRYIEEGIRLADSLGDERLSARFRLALASRLGHRHGDAARVAALMAEVDGLTAKLDDPFLRLEQLNLQSWFLAVFRADFAGAESAASRAVRLAEQLREASGLSEARYQLGHDLLYQFRASEARGILDEAAHDALRIGVHPDRVLAILAAEAECCLMEGDREGFRRIFASLEGLGLTKQRWPYLLVLQGFDGIIRADDEAAQDCFEEAIQSVEKEWSGEESFYRLNVSLLELYYAIALAAMGKPQESADHRDRALGIFRTYGFRNRLLTASEREGRIVEGVKQIRSTPQP